MTTAERTEWPALPRMAPKSYDKECSQSGEGPTPLLLLDVFEKGWRRGRIGVWWGLYEK